MFVPRKIAVVGLGYVGLPLAVHFGEKHPVLGFDILESRIGELRRGVDRNGTFTAAQLQAAQAEFTGDATRLREADFVIVTPPTPVDAAKRPDLSALRSACTLVGQHLARGSIVVIESTVYPGTTEEICIPVLEQASGLTCGVDFKVGYSPERINPGDGEHTFTQVVKVVAGMDAATLEILAEVYGSVVAAGVYKAPSIQVAEAAKVIENTQRDVNIALVNEFALIFQRAGIDTHDVLATARTKWNFLPFNPGLVGGHCIGVDPYYLTHKAEALGYSPRVILSGRSINDGMGAYIAGEVAARLGSSSPDSLSPLVTILGLTFKENVPDLRNSKVVDIVTGLQRLGFRTQVVDPIAHADDALREYGIELVAAESAAPARAVVLAVAHESFRSAGWSGITRFLENATGLVADVKSILPRPAPAGIGLWRL